MKLFDYKFLILLGLTLVVYFMYRELIDVKKRIKEIEAKKENVIEDQKPSNNFVDFQIPLPKKPELDNNNILDLKEELPKPNEMKVDIPDLNHNMVESSESEQIGEHLVEQIAIYSNDNENDKTNSYSLGESSELISEDENMDLSVIPEEKELDEKKKIILVESEGDDQIDMFIENKEEVKINELTNSDFLKYKLNELQCFAEEYKIDIKNNDKKGKKKTKVELANDLVNHFKYKSEEKKNIV